MVGAEQTYCKQYASSLGKGSPATKKKTGDPAAMVSMEEWATYTNLRVLLSNVGSTLYPGDFQGFTPFEIRNYIGLYMLQRLSPSPQVKQKFWPQSVNLINGSDLCFKVFGKNADKRHKMFKAFFTIQDPCKSIPPKSTHPNFKIDPFLHWIQTVSMAAWDLGRCFSCDEQMIGFKGNHADKQCISYKKEGDVFWQMQSTKMDILTVSFFRTCLHPRSTLTRKYHHCTLAVSSSLTNSKTNITWEELTTCTHLQSF